MSSRPIPKPLRLFVVAAVAMATACNLILAIDGEVTDPVVDSSAPDASDGGVGEASSLEYSVAPDRLRLRQSERGRLEVFAKAVPAGSTARLSVDQLPEGVTVAPAILTIDGPGSKTFDVNVDTFAPPVSGSKARVLVERAGKVEAIDFTIDITGPVDLTFGTGGVAALGFDLPSQAPTLKDPEGADWHGVGLLVSSDQRLLVAFSAGDPSAPSISHGRLAKVTANGSPDPSYANGGRLELLGNSRAHDIASLPGDVTLVGGGFSTDGGSQSTTLRLDMNGGPIGGTNFSPLAPGFFNHGLRSLSFGRGPDGGLVGLGIGPSGQYTTHIETPPVQQPGVPLDPDFRAYDLVRGAGDAILVGKTTSSEGAAVSRFRDGAPDTAWGQNGRVVLTGTVSALRAGAADDGGLVFGGSIARGTGVPPVHLQIVRTNQTGAVDVTFGDGGFVALQPRDDVKLAEIDVVLIEPDGHIMTGGHVEIGSRRLGFLARFGANGAIDPAFGVDGVLLVGIGMDAEVRRLGLQGTAIVAAVLTKTPGGTRDVALVRIKP